LQDDPPFPPSRGRPAQGGFEIANAQPGQGGLHAVDDAGAISDQALAFPVWPLGILFGDRRNARHAAMASFSKQASRSVKLGAFWPLRARVPHRPPVQSSPGLLSNRANPFQDPVREVRVQLDPAECCASCATTSTPPPRRSPISISAAGQSSCSSAGSMPPYPAKHNRRAVERAQATGFGGEIPRQSCERIAPRPSPGSPSP
jgi:hypothetical protein